MTSSVSGEEFLKSRNQELCNVQEVFIVNSCHYFLCVFNIVTFFLVYLLFYCLQTTVELHDTDKTDRLCDCDPHTNPSTSPSATPLTIVGPWELIPVEPGWGWGAFWQVTIRQIIYQYSQRCNISQLFYQVDFYYIGSKALVSSGELLAKWFSTC